VKALIPRSPERLNEQYIVVDEDQFEVVAVRDDVVIIEFSSLPEGVNWFDTYQLMYCQAEREPEQVRVLRKATTDERRLFRIPLWIQGEEVPKCCGRPMHFVGQLDDDRICLERPADAKLWWHDNASFYVFTCSRCLECKAIGQQF
jgi:hypothetical protein